MPSRSVSGDKLVKVEEKAHLRAVGVVSSGGFYIIDGPNWWHRLPGQGTTNNNPEAMNCWNGNGRPKLVSCQGNAEQLKVGRCEVKAGN